MIENSFIFHKYKLLFKEVSKEVNPNYTLNTDSKLGVFLSCNII